MNRVTVFPDGVYLRSIKQAGQKVTLNGYAQSNARVSTLMRSIESSPWVGQPELVEIRLVPAPGSPPAAGLKMSEFTLNLQVKRAAPTPVAGPAPAPGKAPPAPAKGGKA